MWPTELLDSVNEPLLRFNSWAILNSRLGKLGSPKLHHVFEMMYPSYDTFTLCQAQIGAHIESGIKFKQFLEFVFSSISMISKDDISSEHDDLRQNNDIRIRSAELNLQQVSYLLSNHCR